MRLGAETQIEAMRLAVGRHFVAVEASEFENPILAYGYVPGAHKNSQKSGFHIAELAVNSKPADSSRHRRATCAAAAIIHHVIATHSVHGLHSRKPGRSIGVHMPGVFNSQDTRTAAIEAGFDSAAIAPFGGLSLYARDSSMVTRYLTELYGFAATRSVNLAQNS